jgi:hypothetical protein
MLTHKNIKWHVHRIFLNDYIKKEKPRLDNRHTNNQTTTTSHTQYPSWVIVDELNTSNEQLWLSKADNTWPTETTATATNTGTWEGRLWRTIVPKPRDTPLETAPILHQQDFQNLYPLPRLRQQPHLQSKSDHEEGGLAPTSSLPSHIPWHCIFDFPM